MGPRNITSTAQGDGRLGGLMETTSELAGFFAAHAVWCIEDGETLVTILAFEMPDGSRQMHRLVTEQVEDSVARGRAWLAENPEGASRAVLIYDGYLTLDTGKVDALILDARLFGPPPQSLLMAVPYRLAEHPDGFAVHRLKFLDFDGAEPDPATIGEAFFRGVEQHERGALVWSEH